MLSLLKWFNLFVLMFHSPSLVRSFAFSRNSGCLHRLSFISLRRTTKPHHVATIDAGIADTDQFDKWAAEEIEIQKQEKLDRIKEMQDEGETIPAYMLDIINKMSDASEEEVPAGQLPIIAIIGRPNTGKSTIVNRLTNSFKVSCPCHVELYQYSILSKLLLPFLYRMEQSYTTSRVLPVIARIAPDIGATTTSKWSTLVA